VDVAGPIVLAAQRGEASVGGGGKEQLPCTGKGTGAFYLGWEIGS